MKVVVAIDDSPYSRHVVDAVCRRHWPADTEFKILTVLEPSSIDEDGNDAWRTTLAEIQDRRHASLTRLCADNRERIEKHINDAIVHFEVRTGDPKSEILDAAVSWNADQILVGAHGRNICPHFLLGSVSRTIAAHAPCSVEIVRSGTASGKQSAKVHDGHASCKH